jgi:hypothetical protein
LGAYQRGVYEQRVKEFHASTSTAKNAPLLKQIAEIKARLGKLKLEQETIKNDKGLNASEKAVTLKKTQHEQSQLEETLATLQSALVGV